MAFDKKVTSYDVSPEEVNDKLVSLTIRRWERMERHSDNGKVLDRGSVRLVEEMDIPISKVSNLVRELTDWPIWFATTDIKDR